MYAMKNRYKKKRHMWCYIGILAVLLTLLWSVPVYATSDDGASSPEEIGVSLYETQTALAAYVNDVVGVNGTDLHDSNRVESTGSVGNAGAYVGYGDADRGFYSFLMSNLTYGASTSTYSAWQEICDSDSNQVYAYTRFGYVLTDSGLDSTASQSGVSFRGVVGIATLLLYVFSELIPKMFSLALMLLSWFNPFSFLSHASSFQGYWHDAFPSAPSQLGVLVDFFCNLFDFITTELTWAVTVPLFIVMVAVQILMLRKPAASPLINLLKRIGFLAIGIPICAGLYTGVLNDLGEIVSNNTASSQIVASTVFDFEAWAKESQLAIPNGILIQSAPSDASDTTAYGNTSNVSTATTANEGTATAEMLRKIRTAAYTINRENHTAFANMNDILVTDYAHFMLSGDLWNSNASSVSNVGNQSFLGLTDLQEDLEVSEGIVNMIWRYTNNSFYRASDFETAYMNLLTTTYRTDMGHTGSTSGSSSNRDTVYDMFDMTNEVDDWMNRKDNDNRCIWKGNTTGQTGDVHLEWVTKSWNIFHGGTLKVDTYTPTSVMTFTSPAAYNSDKGLSVQSMYNFLSTSFDENSIVVYSNMNSVSENTKQQHHSVNMVGGGVLSFAFVMNMLIILAVLVVIAFVFSLKLALTNLKRGFQLLASIPFAMLGAIKSIAQVISYVVAMIMELVVSVFLYMFISDLLILVAMIVESLALSKDVTGLSNTILGAIGCTSMTSDARLHVFLMVTLESVLVLAMFAMLFKYRRAWCRVRIFVSQKMYQLFTLPEMQETFLTVIQGELACGKCGIRQKADTEPILLRNWLRGLLQDLKPYPCGI